MWLMVLSTGQHCPIGSKRRPGSPELGVQYIHVALERLHEAGGICKGWLEPVSATQWATESHGRFLSKSTAGSNPSLKKTGMGGAGEARW